VPVVRTDKEAGGYLATRHLIELGHRHIAHISDSGAYARHPAERTAGYRRALADAGSPWRPEWLVEGRNDVRGGDTCLRTLLDRPGQRPTAIFVFNDQMAIGALHALRELGVRVPEDMAVVGFDGIELGAFTAPSLTTVEQPRADMGRRAVELIFDLLEQRANVPREVTLPVRLVVRESSGAWLRRGPPH
jgi:DNA-binding LacI/PurR family transcriptional regulator